MSKNSSLYLSPPRKNVRRFGGQIIPLHFAVKGRTRIKVPELQNAEFLCSYMENQLALVVGVQSVQANEITGTLLIYHNHDWGPARITAIVSRVWVHIPSEQKKRPQHPPSAKAIVNTVPMTAERRQRPAPPGPHKVWYATGMQELAANFNSSLETGLSSATAAEHLRTYGPNMLTVARPASKISILLDQFKSLPVLLLALSAFFSVITGSVADAVVILMVVGINATIGYITESTSEATINSLTKLVNPLVSVIREGEKREIPSDQIVPGDLLLLNKAKYIAADCRLFDVQNISINEAALTGESIPVHKKAEVLTGREIALADRLNMAYRGTFITGGQAKGLVVATGKETELGKIQQLTTTVKSPKTPIEIELDRIGNQLVLASAAAVGLVFIIGLARGSSLLQLLRSVINLGVAAIPEGLPAVATTTLALGINRMRKKHVLIRRLDAVETLGSVQYLCLDKTGTLTKNQMSVVEIRTGKTVFTIQDKELLAEGKSVNVWQVPELIHLFQVGILCNETEIINNQGSDQLSGSSTENALIRLALTFDSGSGLAQLKERMPILRQEHRAENRNYMVTYHPHADSFFNMVPEARDSLGESPDGKILAAVKGSPEEVLGLCNRIMNDGTISRLTSRWREKIMYQNKEMAGEGLRVLGLAFGLVDNNRDGQKNLVWLGLTGMQDPLRPGIENVIRVCKEAGIKPVILTGDQMPTARAIGKQLQLNGSENLNVYDFSSLEKVDLNSLASLVEKAQVFARVNPTEKLRIVQAFQKRGRVVAMTGDGINDSPALKAANIGVSMGKAGTDAAHDSSALILENDNLESMITAIREGRTIFRNIQKSIHFLLATNLSEIIVMLVSTAAGGELVLSPMQLLWINLISDTTPALALSMEKPEYDILNRKPRDPREPVLNSAFLKRIGLESGVISGGALAACLYGLSRYGVGARTCTITFFTLISAQLLHALSCRSKKPSVFASKPLPPNPYLTGSLLGSFGLQLLLLLIPGLRRLFNLTPLSLSDLVVAGIGALAPLIINELTKNKLPGNPYQESKNFISIFGTPNKEVINNGTANSSGQY